MRNLLENVNDEKEELNVVNIVPRIQLGIVDMYHRCLASHFGLIVVWKKEVVLWNIPWT
jgi:hypothetical protein